MTQRSWPVITDGTTAPNNAIATLRLSPLLSCAHTRRNVRRQTDSATETQPTNEIAPQGYPDDRLPSLHGVNKPADVVVHSKQR